LNRSHSAGEKLREAFHMFAFAPTSTWSNVRPTFSHMAGVTIFPARTPIDPVIVPGWATILSAGIATK